ADDERLGDGQEGPAAPDAALDRPFDEPGGAGDNWGGGEEGALSLARMVGERHRAQDGDPGGAGVGNHREREHELVGGAAARQPVDLEEEVGVEGGEPADALLEAWRQPPSGAYGLDGLAPGQALGGGPGDGRLRRRRLGRGPHERPFAL